MIQQLYERQFKFVCNVPRAFVRAVRQQMSPAELAQRFPAWAQFASVARNCFLDVPIATFADQDTLFANGYGGLYRPYYSTYREFGRDYHLDE